MSDMPYGATGEVLDPLLESMDCKSRGNWCMANKGYCDDEKIQNMYIKPCKSMAKNNRLKKFFDAGNDVKIPDEVFKKILDNYNL